MAARLRAAPDGPVAVQHAGPDAVYVEVGGACVGLVGPRATAVPCALRSAVPLPPVDSASAVSVRGGMLHLGRERVEIGRLVAVTVPRLRLRGTPGALDVRALVGRGDGLTPYGDDVVCGWLAVTRAGGLATPEVDDAVRASLGRTTLLSATLLECALAGEVVPEFGAWLAGGPAGAVEAIGHSSGRGLLEGARLALSGLERVAA